MPANLPNKRQILYFGFAAQVLLIIAISRTYVKWDNDKSLSTAVEKEDEKKQSFVSKISENYIEFFKRVQSNGSQGNFKPIEMKSLTTVKNKIENYSTMQTNCSLWEYDDNWKINEIPKIILDPKRFLYPGLEYGPNNQVMGIEKAMVLSVVLNRTLVVPSFRSHYISGKIKMSPFEMINVKKMCSLISCISEKQFQEICNGSFDVIFQVDPSQTMKRMKPMEDNSVMSILHALEGTKSFPFSKVLEINGNFSTNKDTKAPVYATPFETHKLPAKMGQLRKSYESGASCGAIACAITLPISLKINFPIPVPDAKRLLPVNFIELMYAVTQAVGRPSCVVDAVKHYISEALGGLKYIGVHWRYDEYDFIKRRCSPSKKQRFAKVCKYLTLLKPVYVARAINRAIEHTLNTSVLNIPVYIAAPPSISDFRDEIYNELVKLNKRYSKPKISLNSFLLTNYELCWKQSGWKDVSNIVSLSEMEIMTRSSWFFFSLLSSWSTFSDRHRVVEKDGLVYKMFKKNNFDLVVEELKLG